MNKITAWMGSCPYCAWETIQKSQTAVQASIRLHLAAVHKQWMERVPDAIPQDKRR